MLAAALYEPHLPSFTIRGNQMSMLYYNAHECRTWWSKRTSPSRSRVLITCTEQADGSLYYTGDKFAHGIPVGSAAGYRPAADDDWGWNSFFFHLTILGISEGEPCVERYAPGFPPRWKEHLGLPAVITNDIVSFQVISPSVKLKTTVASPPKAVPSGKKTTREINRNGPIAATLKDGPKISSWAAENGAAGYGPVFEAVMTPASRGPGQHSSKPDGSAVRGGKNVPTAGTSSAWATTPLG